MSPLETEIGERGINISGGQKARLSMARCLYRYETSDLFLFDGASAFELAADVFHEGSASHSRLVRLQLTGFQACKKRSMSILA